MSEYWVSQAKFYCKFCNVWIADNKPTRQLHDGGAKHRFNVDEFHKKKRNEKLFGARSETEIKQQLAEIERAAKEAVAADRLESTGLFYKQPAPLRSGLPPPPPPPSERNALDENISKSKASSFRSSDEGRGRESEAAEEQVQIEDDNTGTYTVDGQTYLEGPKHEDLLKRGMNCEIFIEADDQWYSAVVLGRKDVAVPHTTVILRTFNISYVRVESEIEDDSEAKSELADNDVEGKLSHLDSVGDEEALSEVDARDEGDAVGSDSAGRLPSTASARACVSPPIAEAEAVELNSCQPEAKSVPEVAAVAKRARPSRWDTVKPSTELDASAALAMPSIPPPPTFTFPPPPPPPAHLSSVPSTSIETVAASEQCDTRPRVRGDSALTSSATALEEASTSVHQSAADSEVPEAEVEVIVLSGVRSEHLRLLCDGDGNVLGAQGEIVSTAVSRGGEAPPVEVVASTGFGAWQTVSVRMVDEEEEAALREEEEMREREEARRLRASQVQGSSSSKYREVQSTGSRLQEEDVMSTFDPYGTNLYKGMRVVSDQGPGQDDVETMAKKGEKVGFKKRKKAGGSSAAEEGAGVGAGSSASSHIPASRGPGPCSGISSGVGSSSGYNLVKIKSESGALDPNPQPLGIDEVYIKKEIKLESDIKLEDPEPDLPPPAKMSFGFKHRNTR